MSESTAPTLRKPDLATDRPRPAAPVWHQIPAELQARRNWVVWRYELDAKGKWTKVPYQTNLKPASTTAPRTWCTFAEAKAAYLDRSDHWAGIGYVFSKDDPFCGADFDHCLEHGTPTEWAAAHIAALRASGAYIEVSVSGNGVHAITRATLPGKGIKRPLGEVYDRGRFFTISGRALDPTPIGDGQAAIDALRAALAGAGHSTSPKALRDGTTGTGDRAAALAEHTPAEWEAARELLRTQRDLLIKRSLAATQKEETQGYFAARLLWPELHQRWPHIGVYRADGSLDDSQARAVLARTLYGRGFTFPEYVVIMAHHFAAYCLAKWGTKEAWREELAALWANARDNTPYAPKAPGGKRAPDVAIVAKPRGRASSHAATVERVYTLLQEARAGAQALIHTAELASDAGMHRVTLAGILTELRSAGRIETRRNGRYGGLIVAFPDVAIVCEPAAEYCAPMPETTNDPTPPLEETSTSKATCVSSELREAGYSYSPPPANLAELVREAIDAYGTRYVPAPGRAKPVDRVIAYVHANGAPGVSDSKIAALYREVLQARNRARADEREAAKARKLTITALQRKSKQLATQAAAIERACQTGVEMPDILSYEHNGKTYTTRAPKAPTRRYATWLRYRAGIYAAEEARRAPKEIQLTTHEEWAQVDTATYQQARRELRITKRGPVLVDMPQAPAVACEPVHYEQPTLAEPDYSSPRAQRLIANLRQRQQVAQ